MDALFIVTFQMIPYAVEIIGRNNSYLLVAKNRMGKGAFLLNVHPIIISPDIAKVVKLIASQS